MKTLSHLLAYRFLPSALLLTALAPAGIYAQTPAAPAAKPATTPTAKATPRIVHKAAAGTRPAAAAAPVIKLPANIPVVRGIPKTLVQIVLKYIDSKPGTGDLAKDGWKYSVHYTGWLYDGTKFDSSVDRGTPIDFVQGAHRVIPGWDQGFAGMKVGGKRRLFIPYQLAYGDRGSGPIPPKSDLIFDIELVAQSDPTVPPAPVAPAAATPQSATPPAGTPPPAAKPTTPQ